MAQTYASTGLIPQQWDSKFYFDFVRENRFMRYMGDEENSIIQVREDLSRLPGDKITFAAVRQLTGSGVTGHTKLKGNEEELDSRAMAVTVLPVRHGVAMDKWTLQKSAVDLRTAARQALKMWERSKLRDDIIRALGSINGVAYASATEAQKDTWLTDNADRVLFGAAKSNASSNDHSTSLANVDNTNDKLTPGIVSLAKRMAQLASPPIRPIRTNDNDEEWFVMFCNSLAFRDLVNNATMTQANRDARVRGVETNPLFTGGSLVWDGVIIREIPEIPVITGVGAGSIDVAPNYLVGAQAIGVAWAQRPKSVTQMDDYDFEYGIGIEQIRGIEKLNFGTGSADTANLKMAGVVTVYTAGVADS